MSEKPKRTAVLNRIPTTILANKQTRRTPAEVKRNKAAAEKEAAMAASAEKTVASIQQAKIAAIEDHLRKEDRWNEAHSVRPDLVKASVAKSQSMLQVHLPIPAHTTSRRVQKPQVQLQVEDFEGEPSDEDEDIYADERSINKESDGAISEGMLHLPEESESSDGGVLGTDVFNDDSDDIDEDYVMGNEGGESESDETDANNLDSQAENTQVGKKVKSKSKAKPKRGVFRQAIESKRSLEAIPGNTALQKAASSKRKASNSAPGPGPRVATQEGKRAKRDEPGGLLPGWKNALAKDKRTKISTRNAQTAASRKRNEEDPASDSDPLEYAGGEFDADKPASVTNVARETKKIAIGGIRGQKTTVKIVEPEPVEASRRVPVRTKKEKYTVSSLPFPRGSAARPFVKKWRKTFKPTLIQWASTMQDPFGTNLVMDTVVEEIWMHTFPDISMDVTSDSRAAIIDVAGDVLIDWRSGMGKEALRVVVQAFKKSGVSAEDAPYVATNFLKDFRFIYKTPDATDKKEKGVFMSPMIATVYGSLLKKTIGSDIRFGHSVGGLAVATATERGLELIKSGRLDIESFGNNIDEDSLALGTRKKTSLPGYTEKLWGQKTRAWVTSAKRLNDDNWTAILEEAADTVDTSAFMDDEDDEGADGEGTESLNPMLILAL
ncbi:hypothetical protein BYT27DRAFT_7253190 [Phlegmacium glaucopus]|nr:hypothetical protein BYT27DRAFT_7253190 [Phlegmacium glaucopus]